MSRLDAIFARLRPHGKTALMPFITAGYPSLEVTEAVIPALAQAGASAVEIGIPFSDPIADGPVIAASMHEALRAGVTPAAVFELVRRVRPGVDLGLIVMVSQSIVERRGVERFLEEAAAAGADGLIVPDIDVERARAVRDLAEALNLSFSLLIAPTTAPQRMARVVALCTGFVYVLARLGITGERDSAPDIDGLVEAVRRHTDLPVAVGFGIARREHVQNVTRTADAAIVGSALVRRMGGAEDPVRAAGDFVRDLAAGLNTRAAQPYDGPELK